VLRRRREAAAAGKQVVVLPDVTLLGTVQRILMNWGIDASLFASLDTWALGQLLEAGIDRIAMNNGTLPADWWMPVLEEVLRGESPKRPR
jgi:hypothetical protein